MNHTNISRLQKIPTKKLLSYKWILTRNELAKFSDFYRKELGEKKYWQALEIAVKEEVWLSKK